MTIGLKLRNSIQLHPASLADLSKPERALEYYKRVKGSMRGRGNARLLTTRAIIHSTCLLPTPPAENLFPYDAVSTPLAAEEDSLTYSVKCLIALSISFALFHIFCSRLFLLQFCCMLLHTFIQQWWVEGSTQCGHAMKLRLHHYCHSLPESSK